MSRPRRGQPKRDLVLGLLDERTPERVRRAAVRAAFLAYVQADIPQVVTSLATDGDDLLLWAERWSLLDASGVPPGWVLEVARDTLAGWAAVPAARGRSLTLPSGGAWWPDAIDDPDECGDVLRGSAAWRESWPLRALAWRVCRQQTVADIARALGLVADNKSIDRALRRVARVLGLGLPRLPRGRPRVQ